MEDPKEIMLQLAAQMQTVEEVLVAVVKRIKILKESNYEWDFDKVGHLYAALTVACVKLEQFRDENQSEEEVIKVLDELQQLKEIEENGGGFDIKDLHAILSKLKGKANIKVAMRDVENPDKGWTDLDGKPVDPKLNKELDQEVKKKIIKDSVKESGVKGPFLMGKPGKA